jgi:hypothetical protein
MTEPDDYLTQTLRRAMSEATACVQPSLDGLEHIRAMIDRRPPRPALISVAVAVAERIRYWTWRGHWAVPWAVPPVPLARVVPRLVRPREAAGPGRNAPAHRRQPERTWGFTGLRLAAFLGGIVVLAGVSFAVQPFRHAIMQVSSTMLNGGPGAQANDAGTEGNGSQATPSGGSGSGSASPTSTAAGRPGSSGASGAAVPGATGSAAGASCAPGTGPTTPPASTTGAGSPAMEAAGTGAASPAGTQPAGKGTVAGYCPAATASGTPAATPDASYPGSTPSDGYYYVSSWPAWPADTATPPIDPGTYGNDSPPDTQPPTPTPTPSSTPSPSPTSAPMSAPTSGPVPAGSAQTDQAGPQDPGQRRHGR